MFKFLNKKKVETDSDSQICAEVEQIGAVAGKIWHALSSGNTSLDGLVDQIAAPRDVVMQGVGWLAREGKIQIDSASQVISLVGDEHVKAA